MIGSSFTDNSDGKGERYYVSRVFLRVFSSENDIAMLKLSSRIKLDGTTRKAVTLPSSMDYFPENRTNAHVDGWGNERDILLSSRIYPSV